MEKFQILPFCFQLAASQKFSRQRTLTSISIRASIRLLHLAGAIVVVAIYASDLAFQRSTHHPTPSTDWIFAEVVASLAIITCTLHGICALKNLVWAMWDFVLCVLWASCAGVFGIIFLGSDAGISSLYAGTRNVATMKAAVGIDLVNMVLSLTSFALAVTCCCCARRSTSEAPITMGDEEGVENCSGRGTRTSMESCDKGMRPLHSEHKGDWKDSRCAERSVV